MLDNTPDGFSIYDYIISDYDKALIELMKEVGFERTCYREVWKKHIDGNEHFILGTPEHFLITYGKGEQLLAIQDKYNIGRNE